jgi:hypothetical protein
MYCTSRFLTHFLGACPLLLPLSLPLPSPPPSPLQLLLPAQNTQRQRAAGPREVFHPLTVSPLLLCPPPSPPLRVLLLPSLLPEPPQAAGPTNPRASSTARTARTTACP